MTIFSIPKPSQGHIGVIQANAIASWKALDPGYEIILFGDEEGTGRLAGELGLRHHPEVERSEYGTPLVNSLFQAASRLATHSILCYVNADIILMSDFAAACERVKDLSPFLMVGRRWDTPISQSLDLSQRDWEAELRATIEEKGRLHSAYGIDYFVFNRGLWGETMPPFAIGRTAWDNWLVHRARSLGAQVIDATGVVMAVHQDHAYDPAVLSCDNYANWKGPEVPGNVALAGRRAVNINISDADFSLTAGGLVRQKREVRLTRFIATRFPALARAMVSMGRKIGMYPKDGE